MPLALPSDLKRRFESLPACSGARKTRFQRSARGQPGKGTGGLGISRHRSGRTVFLQVARSNGIDSTGRYRVEGIVILPGRRILRQGFCVWAASMPAQRRGACKGAERSKAIAIDGRVDYPTQWADPFGTLYNGNLHVTALNRRRCCSWVDHRGALQHREPGELVRRLWRRKADRGQGRSNVDPGLRRWCAAITTSS
jgi:hypothetical protein